MEDEWEDMNLASLRPDPTRTSNFNFQEFLTRPLTSTNPQTNTTTHVGAGYTSPESPLPPPPATALSLNSCPGHPFGFPFRPDPFFQAQPSFPNGPESLNVDPFDGLASSCSRIAESEVRNTGDRRNKRMIKNRESAARSRARKQEWISLFSLFLMLTCLVT
ncbi:hypothetical protein Vadar_001755 [Vaccinium darrowii]|uniref:Uncharacterized protein n=1 Tax=Vaccinium darrowii TaxID=229202 RepID=A0ACB7YBF2_9ERIC|nr:hypothetical protein Vadar_001755 [Vaccinium darrowii]